MITLKYGTKNAAVERVENYLEQLSLAYQIDEKRSNRKLVLKDGNLEVKGENAILEHLEELKGELGQWYYCSC